MAYVLVALKDRPFAVRWFEAATGKPRQMSLRTRDRVEAERLVEQLRGGVAVVPGRGRGGQEEFVWYAFGVFLGSPGPRRRARSIT